MHADGIVEWNVDVQERVAQERDEVTTHRHQHRRVREHHGAGGAASDRHAVAADTPQSRLLALYREN